MEIGEFYRQFKRIHNLSFKEDSSDDSKIRAYSILHDGKNAPMKYVAYCENNQVHQIGIYTDFNNETQSVLLGDKSVVRSIQDISSRTELCEIIYELLKSLE